MKRSLLLILLLLISFSVFADAQSRRASKNSKNSKTNQKGNPAIVVDRRLAVLRRLPSLYAIPIQRMSVGREVLVLGEKKGDGVLFYRVRTSTNTVAWVQAEAVVGNFRKNDDQRLAKLVQSSDGFDQIDKAAIFLKTFPKSPLRPAILLLMGDLIEEEAIKISKKAARSLDRSEMAASGAPLHSFYLNFSSLDRYRKIGIRFLFNINTKSYHYDGESWLEIMSRFPKTTFAEEAQSRLETLKEKMSRKK